MANRAINEIQNLYTWSIFYWRDALCVSVCVCGAYRILLSFKLVWCAVCEGLPLCVFLSGVRFSYLCDFLLGLCVVKDSKTPNLDQKCLELSLLISNFKLSLDDFKLLIIGNLKSRLLHFKFPIQTHRRIANNMRKRWYHIQSVIIVWNYFLNISSNISNFKFIYKSLFNFRKSIL